VSLCRYVEGIIELGLTFADARRRIELFALVSYVQKFSLLLRWSDLV